MPILETDIQFFLSGGAANADPSASLGGAISGTAIGAGLHNLFDVVTGAESAAGSTEYRCLYVVNTHATLTLIGAVLYVSAETGGTGVDELVGLGTSAVGGVEQTVADESTAPAGVAFAQANGAGAALTIGDLAPGEHQALWVQRVISAGAPAQNSLTATLTVLGDTAA